MPDELMTEKAVLNNRFLLIKQWGFGFWSDIDHVRSKLLVAEITNRKPIIFWGKDSLFSVDENTNSFEQYFLPISEHSITDVLNPAYTFYPPIWNPANILETDPTRMTRGYRELPSLFTCDANVLVSDVHNFVDELIPWIEEDHPAYGLSVDDVHRYIHNKYFRLQPDIIQEIDEFYHAHLERGPVLAIHVRGGSKFYEDPFWSWVPSQYPQEIDRYLQANPTARVFLLTDDEAILKQFNQLYGNILVYTDCTRKTIDDIELCLKDFHDKRRKGIEIIKDTYLACKCDHFIGNGRSNVTIAIRRLKVWSDDQIKIFI